MAKGGKTISGLFIPVGLDTSKMEDSIKKVKGTLEGFAYDVINTLDKKLDITKTVKNFTTLYKSIGDVKNAAQALSSIKSGDFLKGLDKSQERLSELAKEFGISEQAQKKFLEQAYKTQAIEQETSKFKSLARALDMTNEEFLEFSKSQLKLDFSKEAVTKLIPDDTVEKIKKLNKEYKELTTLAGVSATKEGLQKYVDTNRIKEAVEAIRKLNNENKLTKKDYEAIANATKTSAQQVKEYIKQTEKAKKSSLGLFARTFSPSNVSAGLQSAASAFGVVGGAYGIAELTKSAYQASMKMENLNLAFKSIYGSADIASQKLEFVRKTSDELGISFLVSAEGAKKMFAASKGTVLENDAEKIFKAFSTMGAALKLTGAEMDSVFLAISQSISKGKVTAEELRLQLAERMPGAVTLFARSIGVSTAELDAMLQSGQVGLKELAKFADTVQKTYAAGAKQASKGLQAELARVGNAWFNLKQAFVDSEGTAATLRSVTSSLNSIKDTVPYITAATSVLFEFSKAAGFVLLTAKGLNIAFKTLSIAKFTVDLGMATSATTSFKTVTSSLAGTFKQLHPRLTSAISLFGGLKGILASLAVYGIYELVTAETEAEKTLKKYSVSVQEYINLAQQRANTDKEVAEQVNNVKNSFAEVAKADVKSLFSSYTGDSYTNLTNFQKELTDIVPFFNRIRELIAIPFSDTFEGALPALQKFGKIGEETTKQLLQGLEKGVSSEELYKIQDKFIASFSKTYEELSKLGLGQDVLKNFQEQVEGLLGLQQQIILESERMAKQVVTNTGQAVDFGDAFNRLKEIGKITGSTDVGKAQKIENETAALARNIVELTKQKEAWESLAAAESADDNARRQAIESIRQYNEALESIPSYLQKNNISLDEFAQKVDEVDKETKLSSSQISQYFSIVGESVIDFSKTGSFSLENFTQKILEVVNAIPLIGDNFAGLKERLQQESINLFDTQIADLKKQSQLRNLETSGVKKSTFATVEFLVSKTGESPAKALEIVNKALSGTDDEIMTINKSYAVTKQQIRDIVNSFGYMDKTTTGKGGGISKIEQTINSLREKTEKLKADLKGDKAERFEVTATREIEKYKSILAGGTGTAKQRQELALLIKDYELNSQQYAKMLEERKRLEGAEKWEEMTRRTNERLYELTGQGVKAREEIIKNEFQAELDLLNKFQVKYGLSDEQFKARLVDLEKIKNEKLKEESTKLFDQMQLNSREWYAEYENTAPQMADLTYDLFKGTANAVGDFVATNIKDIHSLGDAFSKLVDDMYVQFARRFSNQMFSSLFKGLFESEESGGWGIFNWVRTLFSEKGNVFTNSPNLHKYTNSVITQPTFFNYGTHVKAYAKGAGLMGEAGPEAVMPLIRTPSGHLGVRSMGQQAPSTIVNVNVINNSDAQVSTRQSQDNQGNLNLELMIEKQVGQAMSRPGSAPFRALNNNYNARMALANR